MPNWQALTCKLKLQIFRNLIRTVIDTSPQWPFAPEPSFTILYGIQHLLLVAPELRIHTVELVEKLLIVDTSDDGLGKEYQLLPVGLLGQMWCWMDNKEKAEQLNRSI